MSLVKYNPFNRSLSRYFDDFFDGGLTNFIGRDYAPGIPSVNVVEADDHFRIELAAPGMEKSDFEVKVDDNRLTISAKRENEEEVKEEGKYMRREFSFTSFARSFELPENVKPEEIKASYDKGVLHIRLPKTEVEVVENARVIDIE